MASSRTVAKGIRITKEAEEYYREKPLNRIVEGLIPLFDSGKLTFDGEEVKISGDGGVHTDKMEFFFKEIEGMASFFGLSTEELTEQVYEMLNEGELTVEEGRLVVVKESWVERLEDVCHDKCIPVEKAVESVIKGLK